MVTMGEVIGLFGVRGWVKVFSHARPRESLFDFGEWWLVKDGNQRQYALSEGQPQGKGLIAKLKGVEDRNAAAGLVGSEIRVPLDALPILPEGEYYWSQLEGLKVKDSFGRELGAVDHLFETGANDVIVVKGEREILIPYVPDVVKHVDLDARTMEVDWDPDY